jgi:chromosome segregation ATPase
VAQLEDKLDRLSCHRVGGLLAQVQDQRKEMQVLKARRTKNMRTVSDANLADQRAKMWRGRAETAEAQLKQYTAQNLDDDAEAHAAQVAKLQQAITGLTARLEQAVHARDEVIAQAERTRSVAEPPKETFMAHGSYTVAVDSLGLELTARAASSRRTRARESSCSSRACSASPSPSASAGCA